MLIAGEDDEMFMIRSLNVMPKTELLTVLENWLSECYTCVKWNMSWSSLFQVFTGVRQGSVLSPVLFSVYIDGISKLHDPNNGAMSYFMPTIFC